MQTDVHVDHMSLSSYKVRKTSGLSCRVNQNARCVFNNIFLTPCRLWYDVGKYCREGQATDGNIAHAHCMLDT
jgi:hypothetical protein